VTQARPWSWADWVEPSWDEALNPPVYSRRVQQAVSAHLEADPKPYCATWRALGGPAYDAALARALAGGDPAYVVGPAPERIDPYRLGELCGAN
jgi:hypothetical protein